MPREAVFECTGETWEIALDQVALQTADTPDGFAMARALLVLAAHELMAHPPSHPNYESNRRVISPVIVVAQRLGGWQLRGTVH